MKINIFNFIRKRNRILRLIFNHYLKTNEEIQTSTKWANWQLRKIKLEKLADRLKIGNSAMNRVYFQSIEERKIIQLKKEAQKQ